MLQVSGRAPMEVVPSIPLACINSISTETLMHIMRFTVSDPRQRPNDTLHTALGLTLVSRRFRRIAHSTHELWTPIRPKFPLTDGQVTFWQDILTHFPTRAIDVEVNIQGKYPGERHTYEALLETVIAEHDRWRKFKIISKTWEPIGFLLHRFQNLVPPPRLEELVILHSDDPGRTANWRDGDETLSFHNRLFGSDVVAPKLSIVKFGATYLDYSLMQSLVRDLVELHLEDHVYPSTSNLPGTILDLLRAPLRLQVLTLTSVDIIFSNLLEPVEFPFLKRLEFRGNSQSAMHLLPLLRAPTLEVLCLGERRFTSNPESPTATSRTIADETMRIVDILFTSTSQDHRLFWNPEGLREVSLEYKECSEQEAAGFLREIRNVETLHVTCSSILSALADNQELSPNLRHLVSRSSVSPSDSQISAILAHRPGITLTIEESSTQGGK